MPASTPVGDPELDLDDLPAAGKPLTFYFEIGVLPPATLGKLQRPGGRPPRAEADPEAVEPSSRPLREHLARLETGRAARGERGDFVSMDYVGSIDGEPFEGGEGRDQMVQLGSGRLIPGFEEQLEGAAAGEERNVKAEFPRRLRRRTSRRARPRVRGERQGGQGQAAARARRRVRARAGGFDTLDELREDIAGKLREADGSAWPTEFREAALDAVVAEAKLDLPDTLVAARADELWERMLHSLTHQGIKPEAYLQITGKTEEEMLEEARPEAEQALRREAVIAAIVESENIEPTEEDILEALGPVAEREGISVEKLRDRLLGSNRLDEVATEIAARRAVDLVAEEAVPIGIDQAKARDALWTPEKEAASKSAEKLWTPGT